MIPKTSRRRQFACYRLRFYAVLAVLTLLSAAVRPAYAAFDGLGSYDPTRWQKSDSQANGSPFNVGWRADHVSFTPGGFMILQLDDIPCPVGCSGMPYASGEYQSLSTFTYGSFATRMKTASDDDPLTTEDGMVTAFFTYTGTAGGPDHDEIDIEILGKDPWTMQTNFFVGGVGNHEASIPLGFDSSAGYHNYGFKWTADKIEWYVDGILVHTEYADTDHDGIIDRPLPSLPGKIMMNMWAGINVDDWLNPFTYPGKPIRAKYDWVQYQP